MKFTINTKSKTITVEQPIGMGEFFGFIKKHIPEWERWQLEVKTVTELRPYTPMVQQVLPVMPSCPTIPNPLEPYDPLRPYVTCCKNNEDGQKD